MCLEMEVQLVNLSTWLCLRSSVVNCMPGRASRMRIRPAKICITFWGWLLAQAGTSGDRYVPRPGSRRWHLGEWTQSFMFRCTCQSREHDLWMITQPMDICTLMCHCIINVCKKAKICMSSHFSWVYVQISSKEAERRLAGHRPLLKWMWGECELYSTYSSTLWALWIYQQGGM